MRMSQCKLCGYQIPTEELRARFRAGLGKCPECNRTGKNVMRTAEGHLYVADGDFQTIGDEPCEQSS